MADQLERARKSLENMKQRCLNPKNSAYPRYGGRGITICSRWLESSENFITDMGLPEGRETIDRIDNDGNYEPRNCRWASYKVQANNQRRGGFAKQNAERTHCVHGHPFSGENLLITAAGRRKCRTCARNDMDNFRSRQHAALRTGGAK